MTASTPDAALAAAVPPAVLRYRRLLLFIAGMGGVLYGYDLGIIDSALLYLDKSIELSAQQTSWIVAALQAGGIFSCILAGLAAELLGRKRIIATSAWLFMASIPIICLSTAFTSLATSRLLQGFSTGMIAVVIPLYLAECLTPAVRGRGMAIFQLMLNVGIMVAQQVGAVFTAMVERHAAAGDPQLAQLQDHAWRWMFSSAAIPGMMFLIGAYIITESPRWLARRGRIAPARQALLRSRTDAEAERELAEMAAVAQPAPGATTSLLQRRYILPFLITLAVLGLNQATGINSMLQYAVVILHQAGMSKTLASTMSSATGFGLVVFTLLAVPLVDRLGRTMLLKIGTAGIIVAMASCAGIFAWNESQTTDVTATVRAAVGEHGLVLPVLAQDGLPMRLEVALDSGAGERMVSVSSTDDAPTLLASADAGHTLTILRARQGPVPSPLLGWAALGAVLLYIAAYAFGPGVCVWLVLSELMPTRIRSLGMGIALVFNTGVATYIAAVFLPTVCHFGYAAMFMAWGGSTVLYFLVAAFVLPETKGRSLEEIEDLFAAKKA